MVNANLQMMRLSSHADIGVSTKDGEVFMAFDTDGDLIDVTMTRDQAVELGRKLLQAANLPVKRQKTGQSSMLAWVSEISNQQSI